METGLKVFLIEPSQTVVYSFGENVMYNAGSLRRLDNVSVDSFREISGLVSDEFGVLPVVVERESGELGIVYAYNERINDITPDIYPIVSLTEILVPDMKQSNVGDRVLTPIPLRAPDSSRLDAYVGHATTRSKVDSPITELEEKVNTLTQQVEEMRTQYEAFIRRYYRLYPVNIPDNISDGLVIGHVITVDEAKHLLTEEGATLSLIPRLQPYAGSNLNDNHLVTIETVDGQTYHAFANYDRETGVMEEFQSA